jgi:RNA polymerase sigma-70 factor (ECF subfamily)
MQAERQPPEAQDVQRLFLQHVNVIKGFIFGLMPDYAAVEDVLHEVFLVVTTKSSVFAPDSDFLSWACSIARNKVLERRRLNRRSFVTLSPAAIDSLFASAQSEDLPALALTADETEALKLCMERLAPRARQAVELRYSDARRPSEIARQMNWTVGAVSVAIARALATLRDCVRRKLADSESR